MKKYLFPIFAILLLVSCMNNSSNQQNNPEKKDSVSTAVIKQDSNTNPVQRFGMITGLKKEKLEYYKTLHAAVWPAVLKQIKESNIQNYSIFLKEIEGKYFLFSYFEYAGKDFKADMQKMATDTATQRWWKETDPTQIPLPEAAGKKETWAKMEEVFHTN